jgi:hypothetical protein
MGCYTGAPDTQQRPLVTGNPAHKYKISTQGIGIGSLSAVVACILNVRRVRWFAPQVQHPSKRPGCACTDNIQRSPPAAPNVTVSINFDTSQSANID